MKSRIIKGFFLIVRLSVLAYPFLIYHFLSKRYMVALYWPVAVSVTLLIAFGRTLFYPPPLVERFARLQKSTLTSEEISYCRNVTQGWCLFFIANGAMAWLLAWRASLKIWTLYNGFISYLLVGLLMGSEYFYRHWRFRPAGAMLTEWMNRWC